LSNLLDRGTQGVTLARRLSAPIGSAGGEAGPAAKGDGDERPGGAAAGVDMGRTKIGVARARRLADMTMMIPAGTEIGCVLDNSIQTDQPGFVSCSVSYDVYGADGTVVLLDRGSQIIGEYRNTTITYGKERVFVVWSRVRTPTGVLVEIDSPGTGPLGEAGFGGWVDNHYGERVGIPILMSVVTYGIQTAVAAAANNAAGNSGNGGNGGNNNTTTGYNNIGQATDQSLQGIMAELAKIKPTLHKNQGDLVNVLVMKDLDMSPAYRLARTGE
jgi:type IV secretion system protein VirB10